MQDDNHSQMNTAMLLSVRHTMAIVYTIS